MRLQPDGGGDLERRKCGVWKFRYLGRWSSTTGPQEVFKLAYLSPGANQRTKGTRGCVDELIWDRSESPRMQCIWHNSSLSCARSCRDILQFIFVLAYPFMQNPWPNPERPADLLAELFCSVARSFNDVTPVLTWNFLCAMARPGLSLFKILNPYLNPQYSSCALGSQLTRARSGSLRAHVCVTNCFILEIAGMKGWSIVAKRPSPPPPPLPYDYNNVFLFCAVGKVGLRLVDHTSRF